MPLVTHTVVEPGGRTPRLARVTITLVASTTGDAEGHDLAANESVGGQWEFRVAGSTWSETLKANSLITPAGTVYRVTERVDNTSYVHHISVPNGAGPYQLEDILVDPPGELASSALGVHLTDTTDVHGIADTAALVTQAGLDAGLAAKANTPIPGTPATALVTTGANLAHKLGANGDEPGAFVAWAADDGYRAQVGFFSLLDSKGIKGTLFLTQTWVDKVGTEPTWNDTYITAAQVQAIAATGHELGTHGVTHEDHAGYLAANGTAAFVARFAAAKTYIETTFGVTVRTGAYPAGLSNTRVRELMERIGHEYYRGTKGMVTRNPPHPLDVPGVDITALTEEAIKAHIDTAVSTRAPVVLLIHAWPPASDAAQATKIGNCIDYASSLGVPQGTFHQAMSERAVWRSGGSVVDAQGNAFHPQVRANRMEVTRDDGIAEHAWLDIDEVTNAPHFDAVGGTTWEFRKAVKAKSTLTAAAASSGLIVQSDTATAGDAAILLRVLRSAAEATNPSTTILQLQQSGHLEVSGSQGGNLTFRDAAGTTVAQFTSGLKNWISSGVGGAMSQNSGTGGSYLTLRNFGVKLLDHNGANSITIRNGTGSPEGAFAAPVGSIWLRTDGGAGSTLYIKETGGATNTGWRAV